MDYRKHFTKIMTILIFFSCCAPSLYSSRRILTQNEAKEELRKVINQDDIGLVAIFLNTILHGLGIEGVNIYGFNFVEQILKNPTTYQLNWKSESFHNYLDMLKNRAVGTSGISRDKADEILNLLVTIASDQPREVLTDEPDEPQSLQPQIVSGQDVREQLKNIVSKDLTNKLFLNSLIQGLGIYKVDLNKSNWPKEIAENVNFQKLKWDSFYFDNVKANAISNAGISQDNANYILDLLKSLHATSQQTQPLQPREVPRVESQSLILDQGLQPLEERQEAIEDSYVVPEEKDLYYNIKMKRYDRTGFLENKHELENRNFGSFNLIMNSSLDSNITKVVKHIILKEDLRNNPFIITGIPTQYIAKGVSSCTFTSLVLASKILENLKNNSPFMIRDTFNFMKEAGRVYSSAFGNQGSDIFDLTTAEQTKDFMDNFTQLRYTVNYNEDFFQQGNAQNILSYLRYLLHNTSSAILSITIPPSSLALIKYKQTYILIDTHSYIKNIFEFTSPTYSTLVVSNSLTFISKILNSAVISPTPEEEKTVSITKFKLKAGQRVSVRSRSTSRRSSSRSARRSPSDSRRSSSRSRRSSTRSRRRD